MLIHKWVKAKSTWLLSNTTHILKHSLLLICLMSGVPDFTGHFSVSYLLLLFALELGLGSPSLLSLPFLFWWYCLLLSLYSSFTDWGPLNYAHFKCILIYLFNCPPDISKRISHRHLKISVTTAEFLSIPPHLALNFILLSNFLNSVDVSSIHLVA